MGSQRPGRSAAPELGLPRARVDALVDYKVRIIDGEAANGPTRVIADSSTGSSSGHDGLGPNIISASAAALADSFEYAIWKRQGGVVSSAAPTSSRRQPR
jgi:hypothetical protein